MNYLKANHSIIKQSAHAPCQVTQCTTTTSRDRPRLEQVAALLLEEHIPRDRVVLLILSLIEQVASGPVLIFGLLRLRVVVSEDLFDLAERLHFNRRIGNSNARVRVLTQSNCRRRREQRGQHAASQKRSKTRCGEERFHESVCLRYWVLELARVPDVGNNYRTHHCPNCGHNAACASSSIRTNCSHDVITRTLPHRLSHIWSAVIHHRFRIRRSRLLFPSRAD